MPSVTGPGGSCTPGLHLCVPRFQAVLLLSPHPSCPAMHYLPPSRASGINIRSCVLGASLPVGLGLVPFSTDISRGAPGQLSLGSEGRNVEHIGCKLHHCPASCIPAGQAAQAVRQSISYSNFMSPPLKSIVPLRLACLFVLELPLFHDHVTHGASLGGSSLSLFIDTS